MAPPKLIRPRRGIDFGKICLKVCSLVSRVVNKVSIDFSSELKVNSCFLSCSVGKSPLMMERASSYGSILTSIAIRQTSLLSIMSLSFKNITFLSSGWTNVSAAIESSRHPATARNSKGTFMKFCIPKIFLKIC